MSSKALEQVTLVAAPRWDVTICFPQSPVSFSLAQFCHYHWSTREKGSQGLMVVCGGLWQHKDLAVPFQHSSKHASTLTLKHHCPGVESFSNPNTTAVRWGTVSLCPAPPHIGFYEVSVCSPTVACDMFVLWVGWFNWYCVLKGLAHRQS